MRWRLAGWVGPDSEDFIYFIVEEWREREREREESNLSDFLQQQCNIHVSLSLDLSLK